MTYTKGPWEYYRDYDYASITSLHGSEIINSYKDNNEGNESDYLLIAAAPDLLEALEKLYLGFKGKCTKEFQEEIEAAIAKAKGEQS